MDILSLFAQFENPVYTIISEEQLKKLKNSSKLIYEENTLISDYIRIFKMNEFYIFQERTPKGEILIRKFDDESKAKQLINSRLDIYEKMWNGCGCKVDYFE